MLGAIADILRSRTSEGWLVGGSVRDRLLGRYSPDLDVVVADDPSEVAKRLAGVFHAPWFSLSDRYPTYRVLAPDGHVDVAAVRGGGILTDLAERDFTINAMAVPLSASSASEESERMAVPEYLDEELLLDPFAGAAHLQEGLLVAVSDRIFADDPLRLMRAARFCHTLGMAPETELVGMIRSQATMLPQAAVERVVNEMAITLSAGRAADAVRLWADLELLPVLLPDAWPDAPGLDALDKMLDSPWEYFPSKVAEALQERLAVAVDGAVARPAALRLAAIVQRMGVAEAQSLGRRLKLSGALTSLLTAAARCLSDARGYAPTEGPRMLEELLPGGSEVSREAVMYLWDAAPWEPEIVLLAMAGAVAEAGTEQAASARVAAQDAARRLMVLAVARSRGVTSPPVGGEELMRELGLEGGPVLGKALREVRLAWEAREITSRAGLLELARSWTIERR